MNNDIHMHDAVVLLEDTRTKHFKTGQPPMLRRGQVGTVVMTYDGRAYALLPVAAEKLILLKDTPELAAA